MIDERLFPGGISGIITLIQELTSSDEKIETFSQRNTKIIIIIPFKIVFLNEKKV
ncbi:MAG: hypothetical protein ACTSRC_21110 [Candidatus Helarchaeota archaeon]